LYSLQPHKEWRFIIYVIPPFLTAAALGANFIWNRKSKATLYGILSFLLAISIAGSFLASGTLLAISSLNYPGAHALNRLHQFAPQYLDQQPGDGPAQIRVHMDTLSCMTGVTRFLQYSQDPQALLTATDLTEDHLAKNETIAWIYDKSEDEQKLLDPLFWERFDWVLAERVERVIGKWEVMDTVEGYGGLQVLRPGDDVREDSAVIGGNEKAIGWSRSMTRVRDIMTMAQSYGRKATRGWWIALRMEPRIKILRRQRNDVPVAAMGNLGKPPTNPHAAWDEAKCNPAFDQACPDLGLSMSMMVLAVRHGRVGELDSRLASLGQLFSFFCVVKRTVNHHQFAGQDATSIQTADAGEEHVKQHGPPASIQRKRLEKSNSPGAPSRRIQKLNSYLSKMGSTSTENLSRPSEPVKAPIIEPVRATMTRRWDGARRTTTNWDSIRRVSSQIIGALLPPKMTLMSFQDPELWFPSGDCLVHFYAQGHSRRGASLRVSLAAIESSNCGPLLERYSAQNQAESPSTLSDRSTSSEEDYFNDPSPPAKHELFIPAPAGLSRDDSFRFHLTTRNFFAWMFEKPLVGDRLGDSLLSLMERMNEFRSDEDENLEDLLSYIDSQEYTDFRSCPDHALAVLRFAEKNELLDLWRDSFCHCAGMSDDLESSAEFEFVSRQSKALINRAQLEMDLRLEHAGHSLGNFLEDDLSGALGFSPAAQAHLDRFRSFLNSFYVAKHGYWPPPRVNQFSAALPKSTSRSMYFEFRNLYEYLVDSSSSPELQSNRVADGGICVLQNIAAFDQRRKYASLPHPLPLVPALPNESNKPKTVRKLFKSSHAQKAERRAAALAALSVATNPSDIKVMECSLVREYLRFEKSWTLHEKDDSVSCSDARKIRWILIYAVLQTLISVTRAPTEVRDTEGVPYPLCCQIAGTPPWDEEGKKAAQKVSLKQRLVAMGEVAMRKSKAQQEHQAQREAKASAPIPIPQAPKVAFTTPYLEIQPDHADMFIPKAPAPLFSSSVPTSLLNSFPPPPRQAPPPVPQSDLSSSAPVRPLAISIPRQVSVSRELSVRSPQPQRLGFVGHLINNYSRDRLTVPNNESPSQSKSSSRYSSAPPSGNSSPGGASVSSNSRYNNPSPANTSTPVSSSARTGDSSAWSESSHSDIDDDAMEHQSISGVSVSSVYDEVLYLDEFMQTGRLDKSDVKRWDSVKSVGQLGRSNPEVDHYVFGVAK
ncbi:MAG: hypothetical protein Q9174_003123, partial [Haloplaca sp. 1 TL-2023]